MSPELHGLLGRNRISPHGEGDSRMIRVIRGFLRDESGEDLIEYGLLAAFVAAVATAVIILDPLGLTAAVTAAYQRAVTALNAQ